jgi:hypothetical protein
LDVRGISAQDRRSLLSFGSIAGLGTNVYILQAKLRLYCSNIFTPYGVNRMQIHAVTQTGCVEGQATWNAYSTGNNWTSAGGDHQATNGATLAVPAPLAVGWHSFDIPHTAQYIFGANPTTFDILMRAETENGSDAFVRFTNDASSTPASLWIRALVLD